MLRVLLGVSLALFMGLSTVSAREPAKKAPPKEPAATKKVTKPSPEAAKAERAKKRAAALEETFKTLDKNGDKALTLDELKGKANSSGAAARAERLLKARDKNGDGAISIEEWMAVLEKPKESGKQTEKKRSNKKPSKTK